MVNLYIFILQKRVNQVESTQSQSTKNKVQFEKKEQNAIRFQTKG